MFGPDYSAGCPACSAIADGFNGLEAHLAAHDVMPRATSRSREEEGAGSCEYNFRTAQVWSPPDDAREPCDRWAAVSGTDWARYTCGRPGMSAFALEDGVVYHAYSAYSRGLDGLWGMYQWLDRAPRGRNESRGPGDPLNWFRRHDEYEPA